MTFRQILPITDPRLSEPSMPIDLSAGVPEAIRVLAADLLETSRAVDGAGMAAIQVGEPVRLFVMDLARMDGDTIAFINPKVIETSEEIATRREGCLSMPGIFFDLARPAQVRIAYFDLAGEEQHYVAKDFASMCVLHELDHLDGVRHLDHLSPLKRAMALKKFADQRRRKSRPR